MAEHLSRKVAKGLRMLEHLKSLEASARFFQEHYEKGYGKGGTESHKLVLNIVTKFRDAGIKTVLDVGCGRGLIIKDLLARKFDVTGTEVVPALFEKELRKLPVIMSAIQHLTHTFPDRKFDAVLTVDVLDHLLGEVEVEPAIKQMGLMAKKAIVVSVNGLSLIRSINRDADWWETALTSVLSSEGFVRKERIELADSGLVVFGLWSTE